MQVASKRCQPLISQKSTFARGRPMPSAPDRVPDVRPRRRTQHALLAEELRTAILDGTHPVGSRLPTESALCETHGLSRGTVRVALRALEDQGLITRRP